MSKKPGVAPGSPYPVTPSSSTKGKGKADDPFANKDHGSSSAEDLAWSNPEDVEAHELKYVIYSPQFSSLTCPPIFLFT